MAVKQIQLEMVVPRKMVQMTRDVRRVLDRSLARSGRKVQQELRNTFRDYTVNTFGHLSKQVTKQRPKNFFTEKYTDIEVVGSRAAVAAYLEYGTRPRPTGVEWTGLLKWFEKKGIGRGRSKRDKRALFFAIWRSVSRKGIDPKGYFAITRNRVADDVAKIFNDDLSKYLSKMDDFDLSGEFNGES